MYVVMTGQAHVRARPLNAALAAGSVTVSGRCCLLHGPMRSGKIATVDRDHHCSFGTTLPATPVLHEHKSLEWLYHTHINGLKLCITRFSTCRSRQTRACDE